MLADARAMLRLARWLGPWASSAQAPAVPTLDDAIDGETGRIRIRVYGDAARSTFVIAPGLHHAGPDDPRADRFHRILAAAGHRVIAPFIPDYLALVPGARACRDFAAVVDALPRWGAEHAAVFSISFGSLLALTAAAARPERISRLVVFGGYAELIPTLRFMLTSTVAGVRRFPVDPVNHASVALPVLDQLDGPIDGVADALRAYIARACEDTARTDPALRAAIAAELVTSLAPAARDAFDDALGGRAGSTARIDAAVTRATRLGAELDALAHCPHVRCPVDIVHGTDDDTIPYEQARALAAALVAAPHVGVHVIGGYAHTGYSRAWTVMLRDALATIRILRALA